MAQAVASRPPADESAFPPRFSYSKRLTLLGVLLLLSMGGLRWWWGHEAQRRIDAFVAEVRARGEPILPADFKGKDVPADENAATFYNEASGMIRFSPEDRRVSPSWALTEGDLQDMSEMVERHQPEVRLLHRAADCPRLEWDRLEIYAMGRGTCGVQLALARVLEYSAMCEHARGDDRAAFDDIRAIIALAHAYRSSSDRSLVKIRDYSNDVISKIGFAVKISDKSPATSKAARPRQVRRLIDTLLDDSYWVDGATFEWSMYRTGAIREALDPNAGSIAPTWVVKCLRPMFQLHSLREAEKETRRINADRPPNFGRAMEAFPISRVADRVSQLTGLARNEDVSDNEYFLSIVHGDMQEKLTRYLDAVMLAIHWYRLDHDGKLPASLEAMVPTYLPFVPHDPSSTDNRPLRYSPWGDPPSLENWQLDVKKRQ